MAYLNKWLPGHTFYSINMIHCDTFHQDPAARFRRSSSQTDDCNECINPFGNELFRLCRFIEHSVKLQNTAKLEDVQQWFHCLIVCAVIIRLTTSNWARTKRDLNNNRSLTILIFAVCHFAVTVCGWFFPFPMYLTDCPPIDDWSIVLSWSHCLQLRHVQRNHQLFRTASRHESRIR